MTILVSMPYYGAPDLVARAVRSVLAQTHRDLQVVVIADGDDPPLRRFRDARLEVYRLPQNRGAYFAQSVSLAASPHEWYAPHAADDWSEPDHLERLAAYGQNVATGAVWSHVGPVVSIVRKQFEVGLFRTQTLRSVGGYNPAERLGQDSLMLRLLRVIGSLTASIEPTYHRVHRDDSLCNHPDTRKGSPAREAMRRRNRRVARVCERLGDVDRIRAYRASLIPPRIAHELAGHVERLGVHLGQAVAA